MPYIIRLISGYRHPDKVHQVVTRKSHRQSKSTTEDNHAKDIHFHTDKYLWEYRKENKTANEQKNDISIYPRNGFFRNESNVFESFKNNKVGKTCERQAAKYPSYVFYIVLIFKTEHQSG